MTWGISGPTFLALYGTALVAVVLAAVVARRRVRRGLAVPPRALSLDEIAYLSGGERLVGTSALIGLQESGSLSGSRSALRTTRTPPPPGSAVQAALYGKLSTGGVVDADTARRTAQNDQTVTAIRAELQRLGLVPDAAAASRLRLCTALLGALLLLGVVRFFVGAANDRPVGYLFLMLVAGFLATILGRMPRLTDAGRETLRTVREQREMLRSGGLPGDRALAVALFGAGVLWLADAELAGMLGMRREALAASGDGDAGSCGAGSGSSCGGGSCGGGSSCGGGCGGGGCGG